jgi:hypothetical protein
MGWRGKDGWERRKEYALICITLPSHQTLVAFCGVFRRKDELKIISEEEMENDHARQGGWISSDN